MNAAQVRTLLHEGYSPHGGGGPSNKIVVILIIGAYLVMKGFDKVRSHSR